MKSYLVIADIAGQMDALRRLVALTPQDTVKISVGDMADRGPQSKEVFEYFMDGYGVDKFAVLGNHEHMLLDYFTRERGRRAMYESGVWVSWNGGYDTLESYPDKKVPADVLEWLGNLPLCMEVEHPTQPSLFVSHAPWHDEYPLFPEDLTERDIVALTWNREIPIYHKGYMQIFGHNSSWGLREFRHSEESGDIPYALCIDQSRTKMLTGYLYPECKVLEVPYSLEPPKVSLFEENSEEM